MGNTESKQDHYKVLGVHPNATESRITKAFRSAALKWHPEKRTTGHIDQAYRTLSNRTKRTKYDASRGSGSDGFGKGIVYITGIAVVGYLTYKLFRWVNLKEIAKAASELMGKISQATMEKTMAILNWAFKWKDSDAASSLGSQLASTANTVGKISQSIMEKTINKASELKASDAASALGSQLASSASTVSSASNDVLSKVAKWFQN